MLCDTCPRAYHLVCLDPEMEEAPEGCWSCPHCEKKGISVASLQPDESTTASDGVSTRLPKKGASNTSTEVLDEHQEWCTECRDGGDLICCENCPASYHIGCLDPPLAKIPEGVWLCPRCGCKPLKARVLKILTWRWREPPKVIAPSSSIKNTVEIMNKTINADVTFVDDDADNSNADAPPLSIDLGGANEQEGDESNPVSVDNAKADKVEEKEDKKQKDELVIEILSNTPTPVIPHKRKPTREFFVKFHDMSYWKCEWISELQLDVFHPIMLRVYYKKYDMEEAPPPEDGSTYRLELM